MDELFEAIRKACDPATWSRAVELTRIDAVLGESATDDTVVVRVSTRDKLAAPQVTLYLDDAEWECECDTPADACVHAAAAAIAVRQARRSGAALPVAESPPPKLTYRFRRRDGRLFFDRGVYDGSTFEAIETTLEAIRSGRVQGPRVVITKPDMTVEVALGSWRRGFPPEAALPRLLAALARCEDVRLDGEPVACSPTAVTPVAVVEDAGSGFRVRLEEAPGVDDRFEGGAALVDGVLRPAGQPKLTGRETYAMARGWLFPASGVGELVSEVLPSLRRRIAVAIRTDRLPDALVEPPRILVEVRDDGDVLQATAWVVYGDPPTARVDVGRFVHLGGRPPVRDEDAERSLTHRLAQVLDMVPGLPERFAGEAAVRFAGRLQRFRGEIQGNAHERFFEAPPLVPDIEIAGDDLDVSFVVEERRDGGGAGSRRPPSAGAVLDAWRGGQTMVALPDGGWSPLPGDWLHRFGDRVADLLAARDESGRLPAASIPDLAGLCELLDRPPPPSYERLRVVADGFDGVPPIDPPGHLADVLRPYQRRGVDWLAFLRHAGLGGLLADDMGLGKTVQALSVIDGRCLVVAPTSVIFNWKDEVRKFRPELSVCVYHGPRRALDPGADLTLTSYALLRLDAEALAAVDWDVVILDEAQAIKNPSSQVARAAYGLPGRFRLSMTGTPVENRLDELWSQFHFTNRGMLGGLSDFQARYARPIRDGDEAAAGRLRDRIRPFVLRRMKRDVAPELPPRTDGVMHCALDEDERAVYDAVRAATRDDVVRKLESGGSVLAALEALLRLRQAACHAALVPGQVAPTSAKVRRLMDALETARADGHRALVFSQWTSFLDLIEPHLRDRDIGFERLDGTTRDRAGVVARFQADDGPTAMLISLRAGGTGLNLTAADHVFLMDPWWNPAVEDQAADRTHRIGQDRPVMVYRMVAEDTVEQRILGLQDRKRELADAATGGSAMSTGLTRDDLLGLLD